MAGEVLEETITLLLNDLKGEIDLLKKQNKELQEKIGNYANKFSTYTKEQAEILGKIQEVKQILNNQNITKSGTNNYKNYQYYELEDINKPICDALLSKGLASLFLFKNGYGYLQIIDRKTGAWIQWETPLRKSERYLQQFTSKSSKKGDVGDLMKDEQALQTYARRALYLQALEIAEPNTIEQEGNETINKKNSKVTNNQLVVPEEVDDVTKSIFQQIKKDFGSKVEFNKQTITNKLKSMKTSEKIDEAMYNNCIKTLENM